MDQKIIGLKQMATLSVEMSEIAPGTNEARHRNTSSDFSGNPNELYWYIEVGLNVLQGILAGTVTYDRRKRF